MWLRKKKKKSVVFADSQGLALTVVNVFNKADEDLLTELQFHLSNLEVNASGVNPRDRKGESAEELLIISCLINNSNNRW